MKTCIDILRHGELQTAGLFCANESEPLSKDGLKHCQSATQKGQWDVIVSSPYKRCKDFAEQLAEEKQCPLHINKAFQEMNFGDWTGQTLKSLWEKNETAFTQLWQSPETFVAPNGEAMLAFIKRVQHAWKQLLKEHAGQSILLITHAGIIRALLAEILNISQASTLRFHLGYAEFTQVEYFLDKETNEEADGVYSLRSLGANTSESAR